MTPTQLHERLLADADVPAPVAEGARRFRYGRSEMQIHYALSEPPRWDGDERLASTAIVHVTPGLDGVSRAVNEAERGLLPAEATIVVGQPLTLDPSRAPDGRGLLWIQLQELPWRIKGDAAGETYVGNGEWTDELRERYADRIQARLARHIPNLESSILKRVALGPHDLQRANVNLRHGDPYGGSLALDQNFLWRPFGSSPGHTTPVERLWQIGASTWPGPGLGAGSGTIVARKLLEPPLTQRAVARARSSRRCGGRHVLIRRASRDTIRSRLSEGTQQLPLLLDLAGEHARRELRRRRARVRGGRRRRDRRLGDQARRRLARASSAASGLGSATAVPAVPSVHPAAAAARPRHRAGSGSTRCCARSRFSRRTGRRRSSASPAPATVRPRSAACREIAREAERLGVRLAVEPFQLEGIESWSILNTLGDAAEFVDEVGSDAVGIQFDVWHLWNSADVLDEIPRHAHLIAGVHVSDWREPTRGWADRVLPGDGVSRLARDPRRLRRRGLERVLRPRDLLRQRCLRQRVSRLALGSRRRRARAPRSGRFRPTAGRKGGSRQKPWAGEEKHEGRQPGALGARDRCRCGARPRRGRGGSYTFCGGEGADRHRLGPRLERADGAVRRPGARRGASSRSRRSTRRACWAARSCSRPATRRRTTRRRRRRAPTS